MGWRGWRARDRPFCPPCLLRHCFHPCSDASWWSTVNTDIRSRCRCATLLRFRPRFLLRTPPPRQRPPKDRSATIRAVRATLSYSGLFSLLSPWASSWRWSSLSLSNDSFLVDCTAHEHRAIHHASVAFRLYSAYCVMRISRTHQLPASAVFHRVPTSKLSLIKKTRKQQISTCVPPV